MTLSNTGNAPLNISSLSVSGDFAIATNTCGTSVAARANCNRGVTFTPTATGARPGQFSMTDDAPDSPHVVSLSGTGTAPIAGLSVTSLTFGTQLLGTTSAAQTVTLSNTATAALTISSVAASGDFAQTNTCGSSVAAGANCAINVTFTPTVTGSRSGTLTITSDASGSPHTVSLTGTAPAVTLDGVTPVQATVTVTTAARAMSAPRVPLPPGDGVGAQRAVPLQVRWVLALPMLLATVAAVYDRIRLSGLVLGAMLLVVLGWAACGRGGFVSSSRSSGTAAGTYTLTITGTYTATTSDPARLTNNTTLTLVVN